MRNLMINGNIMEIHLMIVARLLREMVLKKKALIMVRGKKC